MCFALYSFIDGLVCYKKEQAGEILNVGDLISAPRGMNGILYYAKIIEKVESKYKNQRKMYTTESFIILLLDYITILDILNS
jgi:hypothetical protein